MSDRSAHQKTRCRFLRFLLQPILRSAIISKQSTKGYSSMVEQRSPKPLMWVQLLLPLPYENSIQHLLDFFYCQRIPESVQIRDHMLSENGGQLSFYPEHLYETRLKRISENYEICFHFMLCSQPKKHYNLPCNSKQHPFDAEITEG